MSSAGVSAEGEIKLGWKECEGKSFNRISRCRQMRKHTPSKMLKETLFGFSPHVSTRSLPSHCVKNIYKRYFFLFNIYFFLLCTLILFYSMDQCAIFTCVPIFFCFCTSVNAGIYYKRTNKYNQLDVGTNLLIKPSFLCRKVAWQTSIDIIFQ